MKSLAARPHWFPQTRPAHPTAPELPAFARAGVSWLVLASHKLADAVQQPGCALGARKVQLLIRAISDLFGADVSCAMHVHCVNTVKRERG